MPRCPQCTYLVRQLAASGVCAVCAQQAPVTQLPRDVQTPWDIGVTMRGLLVLPRRSTVPLVPRTPRPPTPRTLYACEMPGCVNTVELSLHGHKQLQSKGRPVRCRPCIAQQRLATQRAYHARHRQEGG